ncbi:hypothetical protein BH23PAT1_BH23PAT1_5430 [soil metagenome]
MQPVSDRCYVIYNWAATAIALAIMGGCLAAVLVPGLGFLADELALTYVAFGLVSMHVIYALFIYGGRVKTIGPWASTLVTALFLILTTFYLIHSTGTFLSWYLALWAVIMLASGMFGTYSIVVHGFIITVYFILLSAEVREVNSITIAGGATLAATYVLGLISHVIWKPHYKKKDSVQIAKLSGAVKDKQHISEILVQSIPDGIIVTDTAGKITLINPAAAKMTQWPVDEALGIEVQLVLRFKNEKGEDLPANDNPFIRALTNHEEVQETLATQGRENQENMVSLAVSPITTPKQEIIGTVAVIRDVSTTHAEERRRADFISTASHEMRTPVAAIEGYLALTLNEKVTKIDSKARGYLEKAHSSTQHLGKLFQDLLTSAKAEDGRLVSHPELVEMGTFLEQLTDSFRFSAEKKGLVIEFLIGRSSQEVKDNGSGSSRVIKPLYYVQVDPDRLREVITNLFDNAVKYTESGRISLGLTGNNEVVQVYIKDTGPGIAADDIPHLFQKFYRVDNSSTRTIGGTGLGLFICRKIMELYNGRIWVESKLNEGSTFYLNIPRLSSQKASELSKAEATNAPSALFN